MTDQVQPQTHRRWLVRLTGERFDLEEFPRWFPAGDVHAMEDKGEVFLVSDAFETLSDASDVEAVGEAVLFRMFAVVSLLMPTVRRPTIAAVLREQTNGRRDVFVQLRGSVEGRGKVGFVGAVGGSPVSSGPPPPTQAEEMLNAAAGRPALQNALDLWGNGVLTWPRLYRIVEELKREFSTTVARVGFCTEQELDRFTRTANCAEASGLDARHAAGLFVPPSDPMKIDAARSLVRSVLVKAFEKRQADNVAAKHGGA